MNAAVTRPDTSLCSDMKMNGAANVAQIASVQLRSAATVHYSQCGLFIASINHDKDTFDDVR